MPRSLIIYIAILLLATGSFAQADTDSVEKKPVESVVTEPAAKPDDTLAAMRHEVRHEANPIVTLETEYGKMVVELYHDVAPAHADSFLARCEDGFYSGTKFHRIIKNFMIQGGNPFLMKKQSVDYYLPNELNDLPHKFGTLSMASRGTPTTAQTQFFVCLAQNYKTKPLDGRYVVFGQVLKGFDALYAIGQINVQKSQAMRGEMSAPVEDVFLTNAYRSDAEGKPLK